MNRVASSPIIVIASIAFGLLIMTGLALLPGFYFKARQAGSQIAKLQTELTTVRTHGTRDSELLSKVQSQLDAVTAERDKLTTVVADLSFEAQKVTLLESELAKHDEDTRRLSAENTAKDDTLALVWKAVGAEKGQDLIVCVERRMRELAEARTTVKDLESKIATAESDAKRDKPDQRAIAALEPNEWRPSETLLSPQPTNAVPVTVGYCPIPPQLPQDVSLNPGEVLVSKTDWYRP